MPGDAVGQRRRRAVELGVQFTPTADGFVSGVRFYKGTGNTGTHTGTLWTADRRAAGLGDVLRETATGWQTLHVRPARPGRRRRRPTSCPTTRPTGHYAADSNYFSDQDHGPRR